MLLFQGRIALVLAVNKYFFKKLKNLFANTYLAFIYSTVHPLYSRISFAKHKIFRTVILN